jgi:hypothetical protein
MENRQKFFHGLCLHSIDGLLVSRVQQDSAARGGKLACNLLASTFIRSRNQCDFFARDFYIGSFCSLYAD